MSESCDKKGCWIDTLQCAQGHKDYTKCLHYRFASDKKGEASGAEAFAAAQSGARLPWSGRALGFEDISLISARSPTTLVGLIGPYSAGKTTFLISMFVHFAKTGEINGNGFAGSLSLQGWENLKAHTEWPSLVGPFFPPHTPDNGQRIPSLLHLALRTSEGFLNDILFTDAPGEWFTRWIHNQSAQEAAGANWIAEHATHFLFFVDRQALAGPEMGVVRTKIAALARVLKEQRRNRPVIVLWSKSDEQLDADVERDVNSTLQRFFGKHQSFNVSSKTAECLKVFNAVLGISEKFPPMTSHLLHPSASAFLSYSKKNRKSAV